MAKQKPTPKSELMQRQFITLKDASVLFERTEEEIMTYVESGVVPTSAYCYPAFFGDGKAIAFFPKRLEEVIAAIPKAEKPTKSKK